MQCFIEKILSISASVPGALRGWFLLASIVSIVPSMTAASSDNMADRVTISLRGRIMPRCTLTGLQASMFADPGPLRISQIRRDFEVNCNAPFIVTLSSARGGLRHASTGKDGNGDVFFYHANLKILTDSGRTITLDCDGRDLAPDGAGCRGASGEDTAIGKQAVLTVRWSVPKGVTAGSYTDDLRVNFNMQD